MALFTNGVSPARRDARSARSDGGGDGNGGDEGGSEGGGTTLGWLCHACECTKSVFLFAVGSKEAVLLVLESGCDLDTLSFSCGSGLASGFQYTIGSSFE
jgi:hypothetical protein